MRQLRHDIVHQGHDLSGNQKRMVYTYLDLVTPAFLSLVGRDGFPERKNNVLDFVLGDQINYFSLRCTKGRIEVYNHFQNLEPADIENNTAQAFNKRLLGEYLDENNIDFFAIASFLICTNMLFEDLMELSMAEDNYDERFRLFELLPRGSDHGSVCLAFAIFVSQNTDLLMKDIPRIVKRMEIDDFQNSECHPIFLLDTQNDKLLHNREMNGEVAPAIVSLAQNNNITMITVPMMQLLNYGSLEYLWNENDLVAIFRIPGLITTPPGYTPVGKVRCVYKNRSVLSVTLRACA